MCFPPLRVAFLAVLLVLLPPPRALGGEAGVLSVEESLSSALALLNGGDAEGALQILTDAESRHGSHHRIWEIKILIETSRQAQFLMPTVITLVYGLGFGMVLVLLVPPALIAIQHDFGLALNSGPAIGHGNGPNSAVEASIRQGWVERFRVSGFAVLCV